MEPPDIQDAALLAARAPLDGALSPKEVDVGTAWLDLRGTRTPVLLDRADRAARSLGPCLSLQDGARLVVSVDGPHPQAVAMTMAGALRENGLADLPVAVVRGEDVLGGLEEFLVAGCELRNEAPPHQTLREESRTPLAAVAAAPPSALRDAFEAGARIVVSQSADRATIEAAFGEGPTPEHRGAVTLWFADGFRVAVAFDDRRPVDDLRSLLPSRLPAGVDAVFTEADDHKLLRLASPDPEAFDNACRLCGLLLDGLPTRLDKLATTVYDKWTARAPAELLEFGFELQTAQEWVER